MKRNSKLVGPMLCIMANDTAGNFFARVYNK
jgi:hypothetical protein